MTSNSDTVLSMLRELDRDRYLACLLSPDDHRHSLAALYAFNAEIARVRDVTREVLPGEMRLQWWRDLLEGNAHGDAGGNPVAAGLLAAIETHRLPRETFLAMIDARTGDLYDDPPASRNALEGYAGETAAALIQLASLILSPGDAASAATAGHAGVAQAIAGLVMLMPLHRSRGQLLIPLDILAATGLDRETFLDGKDEARIAAAIEAFAGLGLEHLGKARRAGPVSRSVFAAFLPVALAEPVLKRALKRPVSIFENSIQPPQWRRQLRMMKAQLVQRF